MTPLGRCETDEERIALLGRLALVWNEHPKLRLGQLIANIVGSRQTAGGPELYYIEDERLMGALEEFYKEGR